MTDLLFQGTPVVASGHLICPSFSPLSYLPQWFRHKWWRLKAPPCFLGVLLQALVETKICRALPSLSALLVFLLLLPFFFVYIFINLNLIFNTHMAYFLSQGTPLVARGHHICPSLSPFYYLPQWFRHYSGVLPISRSFLSRAHSPSVAVTLRNKIKTRSYCSAGI